MTTWSTTATSLLISGHTNPFLPSFLPSLFLVLIRLFPDSRMRCETRAHDFFFHSECPSVRPEDFCPFLVVVQVFTTLKAEHWQKSHVCSFSYCCSAGPRLRANQLYKNINKLETFARDCSSQRRKGSIMKQKREKFSY